MNIALNKSKILLSENNTKDIVIVNVDNLISFPVQIYKKENGDYFVVLPKRNRKINYGINTEYIEFTDMKYRDEFLNQIKDLYKSGKIEEMKEKEDLHRKIDDNLEIKIEFIPIENKYVTELLNITLYDKIKFKGFKVIFNKTDIKITTPCFMKEKDLLNRFKLHDKLYKLLLNEVSNNITI